MAHKKASYGPQPVTETVVDVDVESDGSHTVTTKFGNACIVYRGCRRRYRAFEQVTEPIESRTKSIALPPWSPWDGADEEE